MKSPSLLRYLSVCGIDGTLFSLSLCLVSLAPARMGARPLQFTIRLWRKWFGSPLARGNFRKYARRFRKLSRETGYSGKNRRAACVESYVGHLLNRAFKRPPMSAYLIKVLQTKWRGVVVLESPVPKGPAILVMAHQTGVYSASKICFDQDDFLIVSRDLVHFSERGEVSQQDLDMRRTRHLIEARRLLKRGKLVGILADGRKGNQTTDIAFFGRRKPLQSGFQALAIQNRVPVIFATAVWTRDGQLKMGFSPPLDLFSQGIATEDANAVLTQWYADHLRSIYRNAPQTLTTVAIKSFFKLEKAGQDGAGSDPVA